MVGKFCPICKNKNELEAVTCAFCGAPLGAASQAPVTTVPILSVQPELILKRSERLQYLAEYPPDVLILFVMEDDLPLVVPGLRPSTVLGRNITNTPSEMVDFSNYGPDLGVSRQHAQISFAGGYAIEDLDSTNGTWLNQARLVPHRSYPLHSGDEIRLGSLRLNIYYHPSEADRSSADMVLLLAETLGASEGRRRITPTYLAKVIQPYLAALADLQQATDEMLGRQSRELVINTMSAMRPELPIGLSLTGASQAISLMEGFVIPWRHEHEADLKLLLAGWPQPAPDTPEAEAAAWRAAAENLRAALPALAQNVADHLAVLLSVKGQPEVAQRLLPALSVLATSPLQSMLDKPRPEQKGLA
jgi:hypothetical protein